MFSPFLFFLLFFNFPVLSLSSSFINLIPTIITNGRFVHEYQIDINTILNTSSLISDIETISKENQSNCTHDFQIFIKDLKSKELWAMKTLDAWGKMPSGLLQGNIFWIGSVFECEHHLRAWNDIKIEQPFLTHSCTIGNGISPNGIRPVYGICVPHSCNSTDVVHLLNRNFIQLPWLKQTMNITTELVHCIEKRSLDATAICTILLLSIIVLLVLLFTGMHIAYNQKKPKRSVDSPLIASEPVWSRTTTSGNRITTADPSTEPDERERSVALDDQSPLVLGTKESVDFVAHKLISCCSLINNYCIFKSESYPNNLSCLNGIRVLSFCWILLGHTIVYAVYYSDNPITIFNWTRRFWFQMIVQTGFSFDSFFLLSGLLTAFTYFISKSENERFSFCKFLLDHYVYQYLRYTLLYGIILLVYITLSPYLGQGGPMYPTDGIESASCRRTWWRNLLYINNFFDMRDSCMPVTWFFAVNMQFHWIAPLFLLIVSWKWLVGLLVSVLLIATDIISTSVVVTKNNYDHGVLGDLFSNTSQPLNLTTGYFNDVYVKPWCRLSPYSVGLMVGYIFYEVCQRSNIAAWDVTSTRATIYNRSHYLKQIIFWMSSLTILGLCIFGTYGDYSGHPLTRSGRIAFLALSRLGWSIGLSILISICFTGNGGILNRWLSQTYFYSLSKLTYGAYFWHTLIIFVNYLSRDQATHYTISNILFNWICYFIFSYTFSFFTALLLEFPTVQLLKFFFQHQNIPSNR